MFSTGIVIWALVLLAIFSHVTVIERIAYVRRISHQPMEISAANMLIVEKDNGANNGQLPTNLGMNEVREPSVRPVPTSVPPFNGGAHQE